MLITKSEIRNPKGHPAVFGFAELKVRNSDFVIRISDFVIRIYVFDGKGKLFSEKCCLDMKSITGI